MPNLDDLKRLHMMQVEQLSKSRRKLAVAAIAYTAEAAEFGERNGDAIAELESCALDFSLATRNEHDAGQALELAEMAERKA